MSLKVWLPLNGDLENKGCSNITMINRGVTTNTSGKIGACYYFNASSYLYENTYNWSNFNPSHFSFCCWYKLPSPVASGNSLMICIGTNSGWNNIRIGLLRRTSNGYPLFSVSDGSNAVNYNCTATTFTLDTWNHIACTYDNGTIKIYLNGVINKTYTTTIVPVLDSSQHLGIGAASNGAEKLTGYLNDVRIYDHVLSAAEVKEISLGLVLHYKLNDLYMNTTTNLLTGKSETFTSWGSYGFGSHGQITIANISPALSGQVALVTQKDNGNYAGEIATSFGNSIMNKGESLTFSAYVKGNENIIGKTGYLHLYNTNGTNTQSTGTSFIFTGNWQRVSYTLTWNYDTPSNASGNCYIYCTRQLGESFFVSNCQVERGTVVTPYTENTREGMGIVDSSGYNNNGTINGTLNITNEAYRYNHSVYMPKASTITHNRPVFGGTDLEWTCAAWVKLDTTNLNYLYLNNFNSGNHIVYGANSTPLLYLNSGTNDYYNYGNLAVSAGVWTHIAFVFKNSNATKLIYINGINHTNTSGPNRTSTPGGIPDIITIGYNLAGYISDYRIYCTALSESDIQLLYNTNVKIDDTHKIHTFEFDEINGNKCSLILNLIGSTTPTYDSITDTYTFTLPAKTDGTTNIFLLYNTNIGTTGKVLQFPWNTAYRFTFDVYSDVACSLYIDYNNYGVNSSLSGNDNDVVGSRLASTFNISANTWTKIVAGATNANETKNSTHQALWDGSTLNRNANESQTIIKICNLRWYLVDDTHKLYKTGILKNNQFIEREKASFNNKEKCLEASGFIEK